MNALDLRNKKTFSDPGSVRWMSKLDGFVDDGERRIFADLLDEISGQPILDLGVGAGRTIPLLAPVASEYVAVDYLPVMVESARARFPRVRIEVGDARDLSRFDDGSFKLVVFSFAGLDAVDHSGRKRVLHEVSRVLKPGGIFWFSTLNKAGHEMSRRPWRPDNFQQVHQHKNLLDSMRDLKQIVEGTLNYYSLLKFAEDGEGWAVSPFAAHAFGLLVHYITLERQIQDLWQSGFGADIRVVDAAGNPVVAGRTDLHDIDFFNIAARKI